MSKETKYQVIISDKAKQMIGMHIRFMAQVNREAASSKRKELIAAMRSLEQMPQRFPFFEGPYTRVHPILPAILSSSAANNSSLSFSIFSRLLYVSISITTKSPSLRQGSQGEELRICGAGFAP